VIRKDATGHREAGVVTGDEGLASALRTHQIDAIVGEHDIMFVRLKEAKDTLETSRDQSRALAAHLLSVRDSERAAIARELHDEFGQALTSLQLGLAWLSRNLHQGPRPLQTKIRSLSDTTTGMMRRVRNITVELRPGALDELGLAKTLRAMGREFKQTTGMQCRFTTNTAGVTFDRLVAVAVFRIVQAALTNVARHARATTAAITLLRVQDDLVITVKDNGRGISRKQIDSKSSIGISGMRERVRAFGGTFTLAGSREKGTTVTARIPLSRARVGTATQD
jgi:signal transduction histidine kinase